MALGEFKNPVPFGLGQLFLLGTIHLGCSWVFW